MTRRGCFRDRSLEGLSWVYDVCIVNLEESGMIPRLRKHKFLMFIRSERYTHSDARNVSDSD
jgi:hypothetical protein